MKYEDIFKIYPHKEDKPVNVDPKLLATARRIESANRYKSNGRMLVDARENPHERIVPEGFCVTCKGFTTNYTSRGECSECGTKVTADISEGEK